MDRPCSPACVALMSGPLVTPASTTNRPTESPLIMRLRMGKVCRSALVCHRKTPVITAPVGGDFVGQFRVFRGIEKFQPAAEYGNGWPFAASAA